MLKKNQQEKSVTWRNLVGILGWGAEDSSVPPIPVKSLFTTVDSDTDDSNDN